VRFSTGVTLIVGGYFVFFSPFVVCSDSVVITGASYCLERLVSETSSFIHHLLPCFENSDMPVYIVGFFWSLGGILSPDACPGTASDSPEWEFA